MGHIFIKSVNILSEEIDTVKKNCSEIKPRTTYIFPNSSRRGKVLGYVNNKFLHAEIDDDGDNRRYRLYIIPLAYEKAYGWDGPTFINILNPEMKEVKKEDLPLYINWKTTKYFKKFLDRSK